MIPLRDVIPSRTVPVVTMGIIGLNVIVFLYEWSLSEAEFQQFIAVFGLVPAAFHVPAVFTSMFLHGGWLHIVGNMLYMWIFGDNVEDRMGHGRFLAFYLLCGVVAGVGQTALNPGSVVPMVGASGAIAGVMGAYLVLFPHSRVLTLIPFIIFWEIVEIPAVFLLGFWFLMQFFSGVGSLGAANDVGGVAFWAHAAGFIAGAVLVFAFRRPERQRVEWWSP